MRQSTRQIIKQIIESKKGHEAMKTGFNKLDDFLDGGFFKGELIVIGAHTGIGKSLIAGQLFYEIAKQGYKSAYFSLEISNEMILSRILGSISDIKPTMVRYGYLHKEEHERKIKAESEIISLGDLINFYDDVYTFSEMEKEIKTNEYEFVVIDFIQNILDKSSDEYSRLTKLAVQLQKLSKETSCTFLVLSQLSNTAAKGGSKSKIVEYKGSGAIAMVCDIGFYLEREGEQEPDQQSNPVTLTIKKNRRGVAGVPLKLIYNYPGGKLSES